MVSWLFQLQKKKNVVVVVVVGGGGGGVTGMASIFSSYEIWSLYFTVHSH